MYLYEEALLIPEAAAATTRTKWTTLGLTMWSQHKTTRTVNPHSKMPQWVPGKHCAVIEPEQEEYYMFPSDPAKTYETFQNRWVIVRNQRLMCPS